MIDVYSTAETEWDLKVEITYLEISFNGSEGSQITTMDMISRVENNLNVVSCFDPGTGQ